MTSINWSFSPVRSGNLAKELDTIFSEDIKHTYDSLEHCGLIILTIGIVLVTILSGLKLIVHTINYLKKPKSNPNTDILNLDRNSQCVTEIDEGEIINPILTLREATQRNKDYYQPSNKIKSHKADQINTLRKYLYQHNLTLRGYIIKVVSHKLTQEDLVKLTISKNIGHTFTTTHITFGDCLNRLIKDVLPERVKLRKKKLSGETYLIAENDDYGFLQEHLRNLYQEPIKVKFDDMTNN